MMTRTYTGGSGGNTLQVLLTYGEMFLNILLISSEYSATFCSSLTCFLTISWKDFHTYLTIFFLLRTFCFLSQMDFMT